MSKKMTVFGAGHKIALVTIPVLAVCLFTGMHYRQFFDFGAIPLSILLGTGLGLMVAGLTINFISAFLMLRAFKHGRLCTGGTYALCRNPMYASFIFLTIPGLSLALNSWAVLPVCSVLYAATSVYADEEEQWLADRFGGEWEAYAQQTGRILPKLLM